MAPIRPPSPRPAESPTGWWLAALLERHSGDEVARYWNNYRLIKANDWRTAYRRAVEMGKSDADTGNRAYSSKSEFLGLTDLVPLYDDFEDGAELLWQELDAEDFRRRPLEILNEATLADIYGPTC